MNAICLVVDGLQAAFLGPYGNSWVTTPACNRLAADGFLFDQTLVDSPRIESICRSLWTGVHALVKPVFVRGPGVVARLSSAGINTQLITDDRLVAEHPLAASFREQMYLRPTTRPHGPAGRATEDINRTELAVFFAEVVELLAKLREPFLLWIHSRGMTGAWDAPWPIRETYLDPLDAESESDVEARLADVREPPRRSLRGAEIDPDELHLLRMAYAAQVTLFDICLGALVQAVEEAPSGQRTLLAVLGARGYPLGQHGEIGFLHPLLHEELIHVPWLLRLGGPCTGCDRSSALTQPADLPATLLDWFGVGSAQFAPRPSRGSSVLPLVHAEPSAQQRDRLLISDEVYTQAIRTSRWYLIREAGENETSPKLRLFVKPDDRWEMNEVSNRAPEVAANLAAVLDQVEMAIVEDRDENLPALDSMLEADFA